MTFDRCTLSAARRHGRCRAPSPPPWRLVERRPHTVALDLPPNSWARCGRAAGDEPGCRFQRLNMASCDPLSAHDSTSTTGRLTSAVEDRVVPCRRIRAQPVASDRLGRMSREGQRFHRVEGGARIDKGREDPTCRGRARLRRARPGEWRFVVLDPVCGLERRSAHKTPSSSSFLTASTRRASCTARAPRASVAAAGVQGGDRGRSAPTVRIQGLQPLFGRCWSPPSAPGYPSRARPRQQHVGEHEIEFLAVGASGGKQADRRNEQASSCQHRRPTDMVGQPPRRRYPPSAQDSRQSLKREVAKTGRIALTSGR